MKTRDIIGQAVGVSGKYIDLGTKILRKGCPELVKAVESDLVSLTHAAAVADLPHDEQRQLLAQGKQAVYARAKQIRRQKAKLKDGGFLALEVDAINEVHARMVAILDTLDESDEIREQIVGLASVFERAVFRALQRR